MARYILCCVEAGTITIPYLKKHAIASSTTDFVFSHGVSQPVKINPAVISFDHQSGKKKDFSAFLIAYWWC